MYGPDVYVWKERGKVWAVLVFAPFTSGATLRPCTRYLHTSPVHGPDVCPKTRHHTPALSNGLRFRQPNVDTYPDALHSFSEFQTPDVYITHIRYYYSTTFGLYSILVPQTGVYIVRYTYLYRRYAHVRMGQANWWASRSSTYVLLYR